MMILLTGVFKDYYIVPTVTTLRPANVTLSIRITPISGSHDVHIILDIFTGET